MSYQEPAALGDELIASESDPAHHVIVPSDDTQDLAFRSIRAIDLRALTPSGPASLEPTRRTPKDIRPMIWIRLNETKSAIFFEVTLHTAQRVQVHVLFDSWRLGTLEPEAVRGAIQRAYLNLVRQKPGSVIVRPGTVSLKILSKHEPQHRHPMETMRENSRSSTIRPAPHQSQDLAKTQGSRSSSARPATYYSNHVQSTRTESSRSSTIRPASHQSQVLSRTQVLRGLTRKRTAHQIQGPSPVRPDIDILMRLSASRHPGQVPATMTQGLETSISEPGIVPCPVISSPQEPQVLSKMLVGGIDKAIDHVREWRDRKRKRRNKVDKPGVSHRKERIGGDIGWREEGNRSGSGSGSGSGELTYSESRSSTSSYTSEKDASEHAAEPSTSTRPQEAVPPTSPHRPSHFGKYGTSTPDARPRVEFGRGISAVDQMPQDMTYR